MERKIIGYRCLVNVKDQFTKGKLYYLRPGKKLCDDSAFTDDCGRTNGFSTCNHINFEPVYEEEGKTVKDIINSIYGLVLNNTHQPNYKLPEKWYIKGGCELSKYFNDNNILNYAAAYSDYGYYISNKGIWIGTPLCNLHGVTKITLTQYLNSINNKMENKKIYYLKQEVKLNQEIDFNGLKIKVTQDLINNNPNLFHVEEEKKEEKFDLLCVKPIYTYLNGNVYNSNGCWTNWEGNFISINKTIYYKNPKGFINKYYRSSNGNFYDVNTNECNIVDICKNVKIATEEEYNKQQEIINNLPEYIKNKISNKVYKVNYRPNKAPELELTKPKLEIPRLAYLSSLFQFYDVSTKQEYDLQEELQQLLDEAQKRYPVGIKLSKDYTVTLHPDKKTYLVYPNKTIEVHVGNGKYIYVRTYTVNSYTYDWLPEYKEPIKDLKYYEDKFNSDFYTVLLLKHPNLYYQLILQTIADDLNGDWKADWMNGGCKYCINFYCTKINIDSHSYTNNPNIYFKSKELTQQAIDIMGEDKLKLIFNIE